MRLRSIALVAGLCTTGAHASPITQIFTFVAAEPFAPTVSGSFTITYNAQPHTPTFVYEEGPTMAGLVVNTYSDPYGSTAPVGFLYYDLPALEFLYVGGIDFLEEKGPSTTEGDFYVTFDLDPSPPTIDYFTRVPEFTLFESYSDIEYFGGSVTETITTVTPEPSTIFLLVTGCLGLAAPIRRRMNP